ncbi:MULTISPECIES: DUF1810 domain-containing protein [Pseudomonas]|uniref:DUF1810 domain-containing protein n=1 Tax=Pseudomonas donghuensis TaxID=1163398 RepID=A0AAP0XDV2_9PSED|nr:MULTISPECIES: DUF1810 domain-containing protein [Pseudomonas]MDF9893253.1 uncharacterized protein (DUF1810 family) [Pseudomonas vranovensis]KDN99104.1 DUF1810 domain-containing protein [Pseudomonas donghuensis]MBF4207321.1 DUF1810 domain-containing protein [Pseudomonas donghuensis]MBS7600918.1 DUF1810 domain-containing protein [Pseudomonas sp. RC2C2]MCP6691151.1 DUF1810 domain-containing protein [Pseudomonas donghuensis]
MADPFNLSRFVDAQEPVYERVMQELQAARKTSHWMWFIFPQLRGLGHSETAERYAISGAEEARAYLQHELLGPRLERCVATLLQHPDKSALQILGHPDELKLRSCLTLFARVAPEPLLFQRALTQFYDGKTDTRTLALLGD